MTPPDEAPRRNHHSVAQMMISVSSLSDPNHHPGTQMMISFGISEPSPHGCPCDAWARSLRAPPLLQLPTAEVQRGVAVSNSHHRPVARVMTRPRDARDRITRRFPGDDSTSSRNRGTVWFPARCLDFELTLARRHLAVARAMISSSGHSLEDHLAVARPMIRARVAERLR